MNRQSKRQSCTNLQKLYASSMLCLVLFLIQNRAASAEALLDSKFAEAGGHDFVSYFGFSKNKSDIQNGGLLDHFFYSPNWTCSLVLSTAPDGRIMRMKLGVPRPLLDDEKVTSRGRDIVKSFVMASAIGTDLVPLKELADEIYVRGLDLQPIKSQSKNFADSGKAVPQLQAYKIGKGPVVNGDNAIFLSQLPKLSKDPSPLFQVIIGKSESLGRVYRNCRLAFINESLKGTQSGGIKLLWCEAWNEGFWQSIQKKPMPQHPATVPEKKGNAVHSKQR